MFIALHVVSTKILFFIVIAYELRFYRHIMGKMNIGFNCCLNAAILTELFLELFVEKSSTKHKQFMQMTYFDLLPLQLKG